MSCVGEAPHLRAAVSRLKDKPFEILAISLDDERGALVDMVKRAKVPGVHTWVPIEWDDHPVRRLYNVQSMPTWFLIDATGVIRARNPFGKELIPAVEAALAPNGKSRARAGSAG